MQESLWGDGRWIVSDETCGERACTRKRCQHTRWVNRTREGGTARIEAASQKDRTVVSITASVEENTSSPSNSVSNGGIDVRDRIHKRRMSSQSGVGSKKSKAFTEDTIKHIRNGVVSNYDASRRGCRATIREWTVVRSCERECK